MGKRFITLGIVILIASIVIKSAYVGFKSIKVDDFHPAAVIFAIDISASNQKDLYKQKNFINAFCKVMDPEDQVKIISISQDAFLIYEGSPQNASGIRKSMDKYTQLEASAWGTGYGVAIKKAMQHALTMQREGYIPAVVIIGDLENEGDVKGQLNWNTLPKNIAAVKKYCPELSMSFLYADPKKLDFVKGKLNPVLGEDKLLIATDEMMDKANRGIMSAMGR
ncbi:MAG: VWA domain-containing protein [Candidatus Gastranaerophilales bacterium]|nr:VWA domain-containing protein [Candidatus Gastranaerophilales bacterium]